MPAEDFSGHIVQSIGGIITLLLSDFVERFPLGEVAAEYAVITFIGATFAGCVGMAIIDSETFISVFIVLHTVTVLKFRAIVNGNGLKGAFRKHGYDTVKGMDGSGGCFGRGTTDDFKTGKTFGEDEERLLFSLRFTNDTVHLPMAKSRTGVDDLRTLFDGKPLWGLGVFIDFGVPAFPFGALRKVFVGDTGNIAFVNVAVQCGSGYSPLPFYFERMNDDIRRNAAADLLSNIAGV